MAVVINEIEVAPEAPPAATRGQGGSDGAAEQALKPQDLREIIARHLERVRRVTAD